MPSPDFPVSILQNGVKMTLEPPKGLRANLVRSYLRFTDKILNDCNKPEEWKRLLFATCLFHAVIQERRKFGPLGWNIRYDFTDGDLSVCQVQVRMFLNEYEQIPYKVQKFSTSQLQLLPPFNYTNVPIHLMIQCFFVLYEFCDVPKMVIIHKKI